MTNATRPTVSHDGFRLGETLDYQLYRANGARGRVVRLSVTEIRVLPTGTAAAIGTTDDGRTLWLYGSRRVAG